jgi:DNA/RNA-binding domain of Phe-tRNA-synthetase-like protein
MSTASETFLSGAKYLNKFLSYDRIIADYWWASKAFRDTQARPPARPSFKKPNRPRGKRYQNSQSTTYHIAAWREAYKGFGAKLKKECNSLESMMRQAEGGLPRVNRLTDICNAISMKHQIPLGCEDLDKYNGSPLLIRSTSQDKFETTSSGETVTELPPAGEVVWCDDAGVTCRRWNWRQCTRTALSDAMTRVLFILDASESCSDDALGAAADELVEVLSNLPLTWARRVSFFERHNPAQSQII